MEIRKIVTVGPDACKGGTCPTFYETDRGSYIVQGGILPTSTLERLGVPEGETAVEIPAELVAAFLNKRSE